MIVIIVITLTVIVTSPHYGASRAILVDAALTLIC